MMENFPKPEDFTQASDYEQTWRWRELTPGVYKLISKTPTTSSFGAGMVLELQDSGGAMFKAWAPDRLIRALADDPEIRWILHEGLKKSAKDPSRQYFAYKTLH